MPCGNWVHKSRHCAGPLNVLRLPFSKPFSAVIGPLDRKHAYCDSSANVRMPIMMKYLYVWKGLGHVILSCMFIATRNLAFHDMKLNNPRKGLMFLLLMFCNSSACYYFVRWFEMNRLCVSGEGGTLEWCRCTVRLRIFRGYTIVLWQVRLPCGYFFVNNYFGKKL